VRKILTCDESGDIGTVVDVTVASFFSDEASHAEIIWKDDQK
jgi:hypothetical protein